MHAFICVHAYACTCKPFVTAYRAVAEHNSAQYSGNTALPPMTLHAYIHVHCTYPTIIQIHMYMYTPYVGYIHVHVYNPHRGYIYPMAIHVAHVVEHWRLKSEALVQSGVAADFSQFSKYIPKLFLMYMHQTVGLLSVHMYTGRAALIRPALQFNRATVHSIHSRTLTSQHLLWHVRNSPRTAPLQFTMLQCPHHMVYTLKCIHLHDSTWDRVVSGDC